MCNHKMFTYAPSPPTAPSDPDAAREILLMLVIVPLDPSPGLEKTSVDVHVGVEELMNPACMSDLTSSSGNLDRGIFSAVGLARNIAVKLCLTGTLRELLSIMLSKSFTRTNTSARLPRPLTTIFLAVPPFTNSAIPLSTAVEELSKACRCETVTTGGRFARWFKTSAVRVEFMPLLSVGKILHCFPCMYNIA